VALRVPRIDQSGQVIDVPVSAHRDDKATRRLSRQAIGTTKATPVEVAADRAPVYPLVLEELLPAAWHCTDQDANNRIEADHGRVKARLRPMRGLKQDRDAGVVVAGTGSSRTYAEVATNWPSRNQRAGGWPSRSTNSPWWSDPVRRALLQRASI
jgi:transposase-like protein